jgi:hypothetical protein
MKTESEVVDTLVFAFTMLYTSPSWGSDERTPEGWEKKADALRHAFSGIVSNIQRDAWEAGAEAMREKICEGNPTIASPISCETLPPFPPDVEVTA